MNEWNCGYAGCDCCFFGEICNLGEAEALFCDIAIETQIEEGRKEFYDAWWEYVSEYED